jgi:restriction system protein
MVTIIEAAISVLQTAGRPLLASEVYSEICKKNLFTFKAKDPIAILKAQLRKNSEGFTGKSASQQPKIRQLSDKKYELL